MKKILLILASVMVIIFVKIAYDWQAPWLNKNPEKDVHASIHFVPHSSVNLTSMGNIFNVNYVCNVDEDCINPYFPAIHIATDAQHNAWLHVVYTDNAEYKDFIDTIPEIYPFYTLTQDFYDAPLWGYSLFSKPLSFWKGHAYAVQVDHAQKIIKCIGGIEWGYRLSYFHLRPQMILPTALSVNDWQKDWQIFKEALNGYEPLESL